MPPRKRARSSPGSSSSSSAAADAAPLVELDGGEPLPPKLIRLWKAGTLTDVTIKMSADGSSFAAHKVVLASGSTYFEGLFQSERSDANAPALADVPSAAFEPLLQYLYEGRCSCEEGLLMPLLHAAKQPTAKTVVMHNVVRTVQQNSTDLRAVSTPSRRGPAPGARAGKSPWPGRRASSRPRG